MTLRKALGAVIRLVLKGRWRDARAISIPLVLAFFFSLTRLPDETVASSARD